jgi:hypothetical protein
MGEENKRWHLMADAPPMSPVFYVSMKELISEDKFNFYALKWSEYDQSYYNVELKVALDKDKHPMYRYLDSHTWCHMATRENSMYAYVEDIAVYGCLKNRKLNGNDGF